MESPIRLIDLTTTDLKAIIGQLLAEMPIAAATSPPDVLDRREAAQLLGVSLSKLDGLCRAEGDAVPYYRVGDVRRFLRADLLDWVRARRAN